MAGNGRAFELLFRDFKTFVEAAKKGRLTSGCPPTSDRFLDFSLSLRLSFQPAASERRDQQPGPERLHGPPLRRTERTQVGRTTSRVWYLIRV